MTSVRRGQRCFTREEVSTSRWRVRAPIWRPSASARMPDNPGTRWRLTRWSAPTSDCFMRTIRAVPPAMGRAFSPCSSRRAKASWRVVGVWKKKSRISDRPSTGSGHSLAGGGHDRLDDLVVAGAAAEIAHEPLLDLVLGGLWVLVEEGLGGDDLAGSADAALEAAVLDEGLLDRVEVILAADALDCREVGAVGLDGQRDAGGDDAAVHEDGAGAADADAAGLFGAGEAEVVAEEVDEGAAGGDAGLVGPVVDREADVMEVAGGDHGHPFLAGEWRRSVQMVRLQATSFKRQAGGARNRSRSEVEGLRATAHGPPGRLSLRCGVDTMRGESREELRMVAYQVIGKPAPRVEGALKVTGAARYTADVALPGTLWGKSLHSPYAHARIRRIDASAARALPGVHAVLTGEDVGGYLFGTTVRDMPVLARDRVRFSGERGGAVAAVDEDTAQQALELIEVEYEELPAVFDPRAAMAAPAPLLHPEFNSYDGVLTGPPQPGVFMMGVPALRAPSNAYARRSSERGEPDKAFAGADLVVEHTYHTQRQHQGYLETQTCLVQIDADGRVQVWSGTKTPHAARNGLAAALEIAPEQILVNHAYIGGDFGGKGMPVTLPICYFLAKATGRPVLMVNDYLEELLAGNPRHATVVRLKTGVKRDGTMTAHEVEFIVDCGAYAAFKPFATIFGPDQAAGPYHVANTRIASAHVYTNTIPGGYMRGPGEAQAVFALESHIDEVARELGMDPVAFRMKNLVEEGEETAFGVRFEGVRAKETLGAAVEAVGYGRPKGANVGRGVAVGERPAGGGGATAAVTFRADGRVVLGTPIFDQGTGVYTLLRQVVAEELGLPPERIEVEVWNTDAVPNDSGVAGSWATRLNTGAGHDAAQEARKALLHFAAERQGWPEEGLSLHGEEIRSRDIEERLRWADLPARGGG